MHGDNQRGQPIGWRDMRYTEAAVDASRRRTTASADTSPEDLPARNRPYLWRSSRLQHEAAVLCCVVLLVSRVKLAAVSKHLTPFSCPTTASHHFLFWHTPPASNWPLSSGAYKFFHSVVLPAYLYLPAKLRDGDSV